MGYQISSILSISPNDMHSYFAYFLPTDRFEYRWINEWVETNFLKIAESLGPSGVVIAPTPSRQVDYVREFDTFVKNQGLLHSGLPFIVFSQHPIHVESGQKKGIIINLAACENARMLGNILDVLVTVCRHDDWNEIESLPEMSKDLSGEFGTRAFARSIEVKPNVFDATSTSIRILFLAADPTDASRLRLGQEFREIQEKLRIAKLREKFRLELPQLSLRPEDVSQALLDMEPQIVHFSGHGTSNGMLCFENRTGQIQFVQPEALAALFEHFANRVFCVVLNACYSESQAIAIAQHIRFVIGMNQAISDQAAIAFAIGFYQALGAGRTIKEAYELGCVQTRLQGIPEHLTPVLIQKGQEQQQTAS